MLISQALRVLHIHGAEEALSSYHQAHTRLAVRGNTNITSRKGQIYMCGRVRAVECIRIWGRELAQALATRSYTNKKRGGDRQTVTLEERQKENEKGTKV